LSCSARALIPGGRGFKSRPRYSSKPPLRRGFRRSGVTGSHDAVVPRRYQGPRQRGKPPSREPFCFHAKAEGPYIWARRGLTAARRGIPLPREGMMRRTRIAIGAAGICLAAAAPAWATFPGAKRTDCIQHRLPPRSVPDRHDGARWLRCALPDGWVPPSLVGGRAADHLFAGLPRAKRRCPCDEG
jgi:hypothetical protein